jgi:DNA adenine methylase
MPQNTVVKKKAVVAKPFVKWAGGKGNLLQKLEALLPTDFDDLENVTYIEPFVGGGAMLFHMLQRHKCITRAVINDINADLIRCYQLIANEPKILIDRLKNIEKCFYNMDLPSRKEFFYDYRDQYNSEGIHPDERAALFIFLNHTCFNGLHRVNAAGKFNVPYGRYKKPVICNEELIMADHWLLNSVELEIRQPGDYKLVRQNLSRYHPNFVYFDPPYRPLSATSSFKEYSNNPFEDRQQEELKQFCDRLSAQNSLIMQSNSDSKTEDGNSYFEALYEGYDIQRLLASRFINADPEKRRKLTEVVIRNY